MQEPLPSRGLVEKKVVIDKIEKLNALGPNAIPIGFYPVCWQVNKDDEVRLFDDFFEHKLDLSKTSTNLYLKDCCWYGWKEQTYTNI